MNVFSDKKIIKEKSAKKRSNIKDNNNQTIEHRIIKFLRGDISNQKITVKLIYGNTYRVNWYEVIKAKGTSVVIDQWRIEKSKFLQIDESKDGFTIKDKTL